MIAVYYFGCWSAAPHDGGHFVWDPQGKMRVRPRDGALFPLPRAESIDGLFVSSRGLQSECVLVTVRSDKVWTILQCPDYTADKRPGSNSALIVEGDHDFGAMRTHFAVHFPTQYARITEVKPLYLRGS